MKKGRSPLVPLGLLIAVQMLDVALHVATEQFEPIRIASNLILAVGAVAGAMMAGPASRTLVPVTAIAYLAMNLWFLSRHGLVNPATEALRLALFALVLASLALAVWLIRRLR